MFPGKPHFTDKDLPSLAGKVYLVTGGNSGIGFDLVKILYAKNATVYIASRSEEKIATAIKEIKSLLPSSTGQLKSIHIDLADLNTVKSGAAAFLAQEGRLDVLFNNAGVAQVPVGSVSVQGYELHMGTNCVGPFLLTQLLLPTIKKTAASSPAGTARVVWCSSGIIDMGSQAVPGGLRLENLAPGNHGQVRGQNYAASKAGNWFLAAELDKRVRKDNIISITQNPGTLNTKGWKVFPWIKILFMPIMYEPIFGAYTECKYSLSLQLLYVHRS